jgi:hypothetical protein
MIAVGKRLGGVAASFLIVGILGLAACERRADQPAREHAPAARDAAVSYEDRSSGDGDAGRDDPRRAAAPRIDGKPMWTANRRYTAEENAQRHFERDGADFDAADVDAYVKKAHAFISKPPKAAETLKRANGDLLIYDGDSNTFAVATRAGAPRTMFKPRDGAAYWEQQKDREKSGGRQASGRSRRSSASDEG